MVYIKVGFDKRYLKRKFLKYSDEELDKEIEQIKFDIQHLNRLKLEIEREKERRNEQ